MQGFALVTPDGREEARRWIVRFVPAESRIAAEAYGPFIDPDVRPVVVYFRSLAAHPPEWYATQGFDLLVVSSAMYERFYRRRDLYAGTASSYDALFTRFPLMAEHSRNGTTIRILKVTSQP
jgi:hypothetical protein